MRHPADAQAAFADPSSWPCGPEGRCRACGAHFNRLRSGAHICREYVLRGCPNPPPPARHAWVDGRCTVCGHRATPAREGSPPAAGRKEGRDALSRPPRRRRR